MSYIHVSDTDGTESRTDWLGFRDAVRAQATPQPTGDGGCKVTEQITVLSFDEDHLLTFVVRGVSYTFRKD